MSMIKLNANVPSDEWELFRKLTRTVDASTAIREAIETWSAAHDGNTEAITMEHAPARKEGPGRPFVKPGVRSQVVHFRIDKEVWDRFVQNSVGLLPGQAPLNAIRWVIKELGGDIEMSSKLAEASDLLFNAVLSKLPYNTLIFFLGAMRVHGAISAEDCPQWLLDEFKKS